MWDCCGAHGCLDHKWIWEGEGVGTCGYGGGFGGVGVGDGEKFIGLGEEALGMSSGVP